MPDKKCPIHNPLNRTRALIAFEILRATVILAIMGWWGWLLVHQADEKTRNMVFWEAVCVFALVGISTGFSLWFYVRDLRRSRGLQSFFAAMAHELRTPLASIRLQAEGLAAKMKSASPYITRLISDTSRLEAQVERGLELARAESGKALTLSAISLDEAWERALSLFTKDERKRLTIMRSPLKSVWADAHAVQVIFRNLIENALIHSEKDTVTVTVHTATDGERVTLLFKDNGKGAKSDRLGKLFHKGPRSKGTGIGLYLIRALMRQQGGSAAFSGTKGFTASLQFKGADHA